MATERKTAHSDSGDPTDTPTQALWTTPIILYREGKKKKRRKRKKYSRGTKGLQRLLLGFASAADRVSRGANRGTKQWVRKTKRSQRKKKDGLIRDAFDNASRAFNTGSREASKAPREISKRFNTRRGWRIVRGANLF